MRTAPEDRIGKGVEAQTQGCLARLGGDEAAQGGTDVSPGREEAEQGLLSASQRAWHLPGRPLQNAIGTPCCNVAGPASVCRLRCFPCQISERLLPSLLLLLRPWHHGQGQRHGQGPLSLPLCNPRHHPSMRRVHRRATTSWGPVSLGPELAAAFEGRTCSASWRRRRWPLLLIAGKGVRRTEAQHVPRRVPDAPRLSLTTEPAAAGRRDCGARPRPPRPRRPRRLRPI